LSEENRLNIMLMLGKNLVQGFNMETLNEVIHKINQINADELQEIANEIFDFDKLSYLAYISEG
jgi:predicted Zn-dependent peptidase